MSDIIVESRKVAEVFARNAALAEAEGTLPKESVEAARDAGLFHALVPKEVGGGGCNATTMIEMLEILSEADGSSGWSVMAPCLMTGIAGAYCGEEAIETIYGGDRLGVIAGMLGPLGKAIEVDGGLKGSGNYQFGSGAKHADWMSGGMLVIENGKPRMLENGQPEVQCVIVPANKAELTGNWDVLGLEGTGSVDFSIPDQFVGNDFTFERTTTTRQRGSRIFELGIAGFSCVGHGGVVLGITARALKEIAELSVNKTRPGYAGVIGDSEVFLHDFAHHEAAYWSCRGYLYSLFEEAERRFDEGEDADQLLIQRMRQALTYVHKVAADVVRWSYEWGGSTVVRSPHPLGRCMRDLSVATQHGYVDPLSYVVAGRAIRDSLLRE